MYYCGIVLEGLRKTTSLDSNRAPPEYKSRALPPDQPVRLQVLKIENICLKFLGW
jgi:hypothetical protein